MPLMVMLLVLLGAGLHASWNGLIKGGQDKHLETASLLALAALLTVVWLPFLPLPARASWPYLAASAVIHQLYFALIVLSYRSGDMSLVYPLTRGSAPVLTALCSALVLGETPTVGGWIGVLLVSGGVLLLGLDSKQSGRFEPTPVLLALSNAAVIVLYTLVDGKGVRLSGHAFSYTSWGFLLCALLFAPTALFARRREAAQHLRMHWKRSLLGAGCSIAAYSLALWAMTRAPIASVAALRECSILFGVLIAAFTLQERISRLRFAAAVLVVAGAIVVKSA